MTIIDYETIMLACANKPQFHIPYEQEFLRLTMFASEKKKTDYCYIPGAGPFSLDWEKLQLFNDRCFLVALDERQISVLLAHLAVFPQFSHIWGLPRRAGWDAGIIQDWGDINDFVEEMEYCLMAGCEVSYLIKSNLLIAAALSGDSVDLDEDIEDLITGVKDYADTGLSPQFIADSSSNVADVLEDAGEQASIDRIAIKTAIDNLADVVSDSDLEDDVANIWSALTNIALILGGVAPVPPVPL